MCKFYFSFIFLMMVYFIEQNAFIVVFYFRNGRFINGKWTYSLSDCKNKFQAKYPLRQLSRSFFLNSHWTNCEQVSNTWNS
jgi:hypothetical protein